jgi:hypothetical protein
MGAYRYYLTPSGLLSPAMLPLGWGLLEVRVRGVRTVLRSHADTCSCQGLRCIPPFTPNARAEALLWTSLVRRLGGPVGIRGRAKAFVDPYLQDETCAYV